MSKNRKKSETYRFNGNPSLHSGSIESVDVKQLASMIEKFQAKLADPDDPDDKKWTERWLDRLRKEHQKKVGALERKQHEKLKHHRNRSGQRADE
ncbi:hypothetical protein NZK35_33665 [Stieleria sp. ICT_E10.1]|uniref:hypothetical protein n=1 Tax=Stieleria sedimenti TaxID=2976331 RepID=UPI00217FC5E5|nr:hypothetical protein [Stieleria sedimenti]MCS7471623.1 hypothetical protein [Stieleria sedimenti]